MATVKIDRFGGISPRTHPSLLADGMAVKAYNVRLKTGKLVPLRQPVKMSGRVVRMENGLGKISDANSLFIWRHGEDFEFIAFPGRVHKADSNVADDEHDRAFITGETGIGPGGREPCVYMVNKKSRSITRMSLVKKSLPAPVVSRTGGDIVPDTEVVPKGIKSVVDINSLEKSSIEKGWMFIVDGAAGDLVYGPKGGVLSVIAGSKVLWNGENWVMYDNYAATSNIRYTFFFQTWVDQYGYESGVSPESAEVVYNDGDAVIVDAVKDADIPPGGGTKDEPAPGVSRRLYKVITGMQAGAIQFIEEFSLDPWGEHTVKIKDEDAGEVLMEITSPPEDLTCMTFVPGNFYVGYSPSQPKTVMFSDVDMPMSWPISYRYDVRDRIVGLAVTSNSVFVLTDGYPWVVTGTAPESMSITVLAGPSACVSERSICVYKNAVYYASNTGISVIFNDANAGTVVQNLTDSIFTKEQWNDLNPSSCLMAQFDGALFCFFTKRDGTKVGYCVDLLKTSCAVTTHDEQSTCLCTDDATDTLYFVRENIEEAG